MPNTEQSIQETGGIPEIELEMEVSGMTMTPVDKTLTVEDMAADAKATGDAIGDLSAEVMSLNEVVETIGIRTGESIPITGETGAETIAQAMSAANQAINGIQEWTGEDIPVNGETGASSLADAVDAANDAISAIQAWTGEDIPVSGETGASSIADAVEAANNAIGAIQEWTGSDIPITGETGAESIAETVAGIQGDVSELQAQTGATIPYGITGETGADETIKEHVDAIAEGIVRSVNNTVPNAAGNVAIDTVDFAKNLRASSNATQRNEDTYIQRTTGGSASIGKGNAILTKLVGNSTHTGFVAEEKSIEYVRVDPDAETDATIDWDTFKTYVTESAELEFTYSSGWLLNGESATLSDYGITITGDPDDNDKIDISYTKEARGTITNATPRSFTSTGWNLYNDSVGYAKVVKYDDNAYYRADGAYSQLQFSTTLNGTKTTITPNQTTHIFSVPNDGFVWVTDGNSTTTAIYPTWDDWTNGYHEDFMAYYISSISFTDIMDTYFTFGLCSIGNVHDEIDIENGRFIARIARIAYDEEDLEDIIALEVPYEYDSSWIYYQNTSATWQQYTINGNYVAYDHGIEFFTTNTAIPITASSSYFPDLKNKLERDVATLSQQTLTNTQKSQVRTNIGAAAETDINTINTKLTDLFKYVFYQTTVASLADGEGIRISASTMGVSTPSGYKPFAIGRYTSGSYRVTTAYINILATGDNNVIGMFNSSGAEQTNIKVGVGIVYIKTGMGI